MKTNKLLPLNLQFFSEEPPAPPVDPPKDPQPPTDEPKFTQADLERIIGERLARQQVTTQKAIDDAKVEAERKQLAEQNDFKTLYEKSQLELEDIRKKAQAERLATKKQSLLLEAGYPADKLADLLDFVTGEDEEAVKASVEKLARVAPPKAAPIDPAVSGGSRQQATQTDGSEIGKAMYDRIKNKLR